MAVKILNTKFLGSILRKNILANYLGSGAGILGPLISVPFYLSFLGPNHYGLIAFVLLTQASLNLLDAGLGQSLVREVSSSLALPDGRRRTSRLILNIERLYWGFALIVALIIGAMSTYISAFWLKLDDLPIGLGILSVYGAALIFLFQFPGALYRSFLIGSQAQVPLNKILIVANIFRHVGGVILVYLYPSIATLHGIPLWR